jgi:gamma-glutamyltranspeptidase / glutathione hydrolase
VFVFGMDVQQAIDAARVRHLGGTRIMLEAPVGAAVRARLQAMGHVVTTESGATYGGGQAIIKLPRGWVAGSDPRKDGHAAGH